MTHQVLLGIRPANYKHEQWPDISMRNRGAKLRLSGKCYIQHVDTCLYKVSFAQRTLYEYIHLNILLGNNNINILNNIKFNKYSLKKLFDLKLIKVEEDKLILIIKYENK